MKRCVITLVVLVAILALAACGGDGYDRAGSPPSTQSAGDATVSAEELGDAGRVLVDSAGKPLYAAAEEADGGVVCSGDCAASWIPLTIDAGAPSGNALPGRLGVVKRADGGRQVTFDGRRLYTFVQDEPGEVTGDGLSDVFEGRQFTWHVVRVGEAPESEREREDAGGSFGY